MLLFLKKLLSYLTEIHIESHPSPLNPHLYVSLRKGRYQLCTDNAVYSFEDKYDNFGIAFKRIDLSPLQGGSGLVLGFGLGSVPILLQKHGIDDCLIKGIELDEHVIELAAKYGLDKIHLPLELIATDAAIYVELQQAQPTFDLIAVDVFEGDVIPDAFQSISFLEKCKSLLTPEGMLLYNTLAATDKDKEMSEEFFFEKFAVVFPGAELMDVRGNYILLSDSRHLKKGMRRPKF